MSKEVFLCLLEQLGLTLLPLLHILMLMLGSVVYLLRTVLECHFQTLFLLSFIIGMLILILASGSTEMLQNSLKVNYLMLQTDVMLSTNPHELIQIFQLYLRSFSSRRL